jgi:acyl dehydratase
MPRSTLALVGVEAVRFLLPVRLGDTIRVDWQLARRDEIDAARGTLTFDNRVVNQRGELVVSYGSSLLVGRRPREAR